MVGNSCKVINLCQWIIPAGSNVDFRVPNEDIYRGVGISTEVRRKVDEDNLEVLHYL
jgi:hypothetical protein